MVRACLPISPSLHVETLLLGEGGMTTLASSAATVDYAPALIPRCQSHHHIKNDEFQRSNDANPRVRLVRRCGRG